MQGATQNFLKLLSQVPELARSGDHWETCQEAFRMKEGTVDEMERHIA